MVTFGDSSYTLEPFTVRSSAGKLVVGESMSSSSKDTNQRRGNRTKAVLPVRVKGRDSAGKVFEELVHTLDVTPEGARLGSVRRELSVLDEITIFYRQRRIQFRVVWVKKLQGTSEFQVGLRAVMQDCEVWGLEFPEFKRRPGSPAAASAAAL